MPNEFATVTYQDIVCAAPTDTWVNQCDTPSECCRSGEFLKITSIGLSCFPFTNKASTYTTYCADCCGIGEFAVLTTIGLRCVGSPCDCDCAAPASGCDTTVNRCVQCAEDSHCSGNAFCDTDTDTNKCTTCTWTDYTCVGDQRVRYCRVDGSTDNLKTERVSCDANYTCSSGSCVRTTPSKPSTPSVTAGSGSCTITAGGAFGYTYRITQGTTGAWQTGNSHTFTGLTNGTTYTFYTQRKQGTCTNYSASISVTCRPVASRVNGACNSSVQNGCSAGTFSDLADTTTQYKWSCQGQHGGTTATCSLAKPCGSCQCTSSTTDTATAGTCSITGQACTTSGCTPSPSCDYSPVCSPLTETETSGSTSNCGATRTRSRSTLCAGGCGSYGAWSGWSGGTACSSGQTCSNGSCITTTPSCSWRSASCGSRVCGPQMTTCGPSGCTGTCAYSDGTVAQPGTTATYPTGCGTCSSGKTCNSSGQCVSQCTPRAASWGSAPSCPSTSSTRCGDSIPTQYASCNTGVDANCNTVQCDLATRPSRSCFGTGTYCSGSTENCQGGSCVNYCSGEIGTPRQGFSPSTASACSNYDSRDWCNSYSNVKRNAFYINRNGDEQTLSYMQGHAPSGAPYISGCEIPQSQKCPEETYANTMENYRIDFEYRNRVSPVRCTSSNSSICGSGYKCLNYHGDRDREDLCESGDNYCLCGRWHISQCRYWCTYDFTVNPPYPNPKNLQRTRYFSAPRGLSTDWHGGTVTYTCESNSCNNGESDVPARVDIIVGDVDGDDRVDGCSQGDNLNIVTASTDDYDKDVSWQCRGNCIGADDRATDKPYRCLSGSVCRGDMLKTINSSCEETGSIDCSRSPSTPYCDYNRTYRGFVAKCVECREDSECSSGTCQGRRCVRDTSCTSHSDCGDAEYCSACGTYGNWNTCSGSGTCTSCTWSGNYCDSSGNVAQRCGYGKKYRKVELCDHGCTDDVKCRSTPDCSATPCSPSCRSEITWYGHCLGHTHSSKPSGHVHSSGGGPRHQHGYYYCAGADQTDTSNRRYQHRSC